MSLDDLKAALLEATHALQRATEAAEKLTPGRRVIRVGANELQSALNDAAPGDTLLLELGSVFAGPIALPRKPAGEEWITLQPDGVPSEEWVRPPREGAHLWMPKILAPHDGRPGVLTDPGAHHYRLWGLEILPATETVPTNDLLLLGDGSEAQHDLAQVPHHLVLRGCYIHGWQAGQVKRGIALNSADTLIRGCHISDIKRKGQDTQAICGWNGPGPFRIEDCYLEAAGENVLFGGADPWIPDLVPSDIEIRGCHIAKPERWKSEPWQVKNLLELKNARRVIIEGNTLENCWPAAQEGWAVVVTALNQDGRAPWSVVRDLHIQRNTLRRAAGAFNLCGVSPLYGYESRGASWIRIVENVCEEIDGPFLQIGDASAVFVADNRADQTGSALKVYGQPQRDFAFLRNRLNHGPYGVLGADRAVGLDTLEHYFPGYAWENNTLVGCDPSLYPPGTMSE